MPQRLQSYFLDCILPSWWNSFQQTDLLKGNNSFPTDIYYSNPSQIPRLQKIVLNRGLGDASKNTKILESSLREFQVRGSHSVEYPESISFICSISIPYPISSTIQTLKTNILRPHDVKTRGDQSMG